MSLSCTISEILSLISQNFRLSYDPAHIPFGGSLSCMHWYSSVSNSTRNLKCIASTIKRYDWGKLKHESRDPDHLHYGAVCYPKASICYDLRFYLRAIFGNSCFSRSGDMTVGVKTENVSRDRDHAHLRGVCHPKARSA